MGQATDGDLWRRAVDGEPDAFGVLFERHAQAVYNYLFRRTADWALAEDLTSVVFLEAWRRRTDVRLERGARPAVAARGGNERSPQQTSLAVAAPRCARAAAARARPRLCR